jgi:hypothetical protein
VASQRRRARAEGSHRRQDEGAAEVADSEVRRGRRQTEVGYPCGRT